MKRLVALRIGSRDQDFTACLRNIRLWHDQNPDHPPMIIKLEAKNGYDGRDGYGPDRLDALIANTLGAGNILKPSDVKGSYATLDAAVRAGNWPSRDSTRGKFLLMEITGAFEAGNPFDHYHTDLEYADYLTGLGGSLTKAMMFPTINGANATDPRTGDHGGTRAQWYVTFDGHNPTVQQAQDRVRLLAAKGATIASSDWTDPQITGFTTTRS